ncbi:MAG TPA: hypothetical protein VD931_12310 [Baekduia sp.]|nr:hypothetical protein [Baekduia sp.]
MSAVRVEVRERFAQALTGRADREWCSPPLARADALALVALLLDAPAAPAGEGPWHRALAGGRRTVRLRPV